MSSGTECYTTFVYASPHPDKRKHLWDALRSISTSIVGAWAVIGDFHAILSGDEKKSSKDPNPLSCRYFQELVFDLGLNDAGFIGPRFTC